MAGRGREARVSGLRERSVTVAGVACRVWEQGTGRPVTFLPGIGGLPRWSPFLDALARERRVTAPSMPGFPGSSALPELDDHLDWLLATCDLLGSCGGVGGDLVAVSVGAALAADVAALWPDAVRRLVLVSPLGVFDPADPSADIFAQPAGGLGALLCSDPARFDAHVALPDGADRVEWTVQQVRAQEAAARLLWPVGDTRLARRLHRAPGPHCWCSAGTTACCRPPTASASSVPCRTRGWRWSTMPATWSTSMRRGPWPAWWRSFSAPEFRRSAVSLGRRAGEQPPRQRRLHTFARRQHQVAAQVAWASGRLACVRRHCDAQFSAGQGERAVRVVGEPLQSGVGALLEVQLRGGLGAVRLHAQVVRRHRQVAGCRLILAWMASGGQHSADPSGIANSCHSAHAGRREHHHEGNNIVD